MSWVTWQDGDGFDDGYVEKTCYMCAHRKDRFCTKTIIDCHFICADWCTKK